MHPEHLDAWVQFAALLIALAGVIMVVRLIKELDDGV